MSGKVCPYCQAEPGEECKLNCPHQYRKEAGQVKGDGADYLRKLWAEEGAPVKE